MSIKQRNCTESNCYHANAHIHQIEGILFAISIKFQQIKIIFDGRPTIIIEFNIKKRVIKNVPFNKKTPFMTNCPSTLINGWIPHPGEFDVVLFCFVKVFFFGVQYDGDSLNDNNGTPETHARSIHKSHSSRFQKQNLSQLKIPQIVSSILNWHQIEIRWYFFLLFARKIK